MEQCKLCNNEKKLVKSHVIPKAFWDLPKNTTGPLAILHANPATRNTPAPLGIYDSHILCEECDGKLGILDQHGAEKLLQDKKKKLFDASENDIYVYEAADSQKIIKFIASIAWRASISTQAFYQRVKLGPYEAKLRDLILNRGSFDLNNAILLTEYDFEQVPTIEPYHFKNAGLNFLIIQANRFSFCIKLDNQPFRAEISRRSLGTGKPVISYIRNWESSRHFEVSAQLVKNSDRPKFWKS